MTPVLTPDLISNSLNNLFKFLFVAAGILYVIFSLLVVRQIDLMKKSLTTKISPFVTTLGIVHLGLALLVLWFFAVWL
jgi:hypothetical protein